MLMNTYFLKDGRSVELKAHPNHSVTTEKDVKGKLQTVHRYHITLPGTDFPIEVVPFDGMIATWVQKGLQGVPPKRGDKVVLGTFSTKVANGDSLPSLVRPGVILVDTEVGPFWVTRLFGGGLPIWAEASKAA
jgi:hypothetical protein